MDKYKADSRIGTIRFLLLVKILIHLRENRSQEYVYIYICICNLNEKNRWNNWKQFLRDCVRFEFNLGN